MGIRQGLSGGICNGFGFPRFAQTPVLLDALANVGSFI
jgi:hypothetical protein